ncbi:MAG: hypothetical protein KF764_13510 [Labilithrix sp.]|nr:hypothetical protein [Labilithrix sp.]MBX3221702.1 hypothetical protein [Labilithrix sp.]
MTRPRSSSLFGALVVLTVALAGCSKDKPKDDDKKAEPTPVPSDLVFNDFIPSTGGGAGLGVRDAGLESGLAEVSGGEPSGASEPGDDKLTVKVTDPGGEPRAVRKYTFVPNKVDKRILTVTQAVSQSAGGQTAPAQEITLKLHLDLTPKQVKPQGATIEAKVTKVELPGAPPQAAQMLAAMNGLAGTFDITSNGEAGEVSFVGNAQMKNQLAESILQGLSQGVQLLVTPLPTVPIGAGAKWELGGKTEAEQGMKRFTLKEVSAEGAVVDSEIEVKVPKRATQSPRGGMMFIEVDGKGKYTQQIRFNQMASRSEGELTVNETIEVPDPKGGGKQTITQVQKAKQLVETPGK